MKRTICLVMLVVGSLMKVNAQTLAEDFTAPFSLNASGWTVLNNSAPQGTIGWFQGNAAATFSAYNGGINDYYAVNYNSTSATNGPGTISNWLITPTLVLMNGATIEFATRTIATNTVYPDRLQVLIAKTPSIDIQAGPSAQGSFTQAVFDVNASLSTSTVSTLNGTVVTGYPQTWTTYTATLSGITGTVTGRIAFRYFVSNAGPVGGNSNYIGLDAVRYNPACARPTFSISSSLSTTAGINVCSGTTVDLNGTVTGTVPVSSYTWSSGANTLSTTVIPTATTTIYTLAGTSTAGCVGSQTISVTATITPTIKVSSFTICAGSQATLSASGATSYTWSAPTATTSTVAVSPTATTVYTVTGIGSSSACPAMATATVDIGSQLSININVNPSTTICAGQAVTVSAVSGAGTYSWNTGSTAPSFTASLATNTVYSVTGTLSGTCTGTGSVAIAVGSLPTFTVTQTNAVCSGGTFSASATGASSHTFMFTGFSSTSNPVSYTTSIVSLSTTVQYSVVGTGTNGCSATSVQQYTVNADPVITATASKFTECINSAVTLSASGAASYTWSGSLSGTGPTLAFPTGTLVKLYPFTVSGTSSVTGCTGVTTLTIQVSDCVGLQSYAAEGSSLRAYPNPFTNELKVSGIEGRVEIYNMVGQLVVKAQVQDNSSIDTQELQKGIYVLKAFDSNGHEVRSLKLIRN